MDSAIDFENITREDFVRLPGKAYKRAAIVAVLKRTKSAMATAEQLGIQVFAAWSVAREEDIPLENLFQRTHGLPVKNYKMIVTGLEKIGNAAEVARKYAKYASPSTVVAIAKELNIDLISGPKNDYSDEDIVSFYNEMKNLKLVAQRAGVCRQTVREVLNRSEVAPPEYSARKAHIRRLVKLHQYKQSLGMV